MSKFNMLLGYARGKVGDIVLYHAHGHENARAYNPSPKNPKSELQMQQRVQMAPIVEFYRASKALLNHSFTARPMQQSSYNAFVQSNLTNPPTLYFTRQMSINHASVIAPYTVSSGTLDPIVHELAGTNIVSNIVTNHTGVYLNKQDLSQTIISNNPGWASGDQLSVCIWHQSTAIETGMPSVTMYLYETTLDLEDTGPVGIPQNYLLNVTGGSLGVAQLAIGLGDRNGGACYIHSRKDINSKLDASPQSIVMPSSDTYLPYTSDAALFDALESYRYQPTKFLVPGGKTSIITPIVRTLISDVFFNDAPIHEQGPALPGTSTTKISLIGQNFDISNMRVSISSNYYISDADLLAAAMPFNEVFQQIEVVTGRIDAKFSTVYQEIRTIAFYLYHEQGNYSSVLYIRRVQPEPRDEAPDPSSRMMLLTEKAKANESLSTEELEELSKLQKQINANINEAKKLIKKSE